MRAAYVNGQIIDGAGKAFRGYMIVDGDRIAEVGAGDLPQTDGSVAVHDISSKTLMPGIIDCHVHLRSDGVADPRAQSASDTDAIAVLRRATYSRSRAGTSAPGSGTVAARPRMGAARSPSARIASSASMAA